jgi:hypothetical protein
MRRSPRSSALLALVALLGAGCATRTSTEPAARAHDPQPAGYAMALERGKEASVELGSSSRLLEEMSRALRGRGSRLAVAQAEALVLPDAFSSPFEAAQGTHVLVNDRMMRFPYRWVPGDSRRRADGDRLTFLVVQAEGRAKPGIAAALTESAIDQALRTWQEAVPCSGPDLVKRTDPGTDCTLVDYTLGLGGYGDPYAADIVNAGFWPGTLFDRVADRGSQYILGITFTLLFTDEAGEPTDLDGDGAYDVARKEIYYNNTFDWSVEGGFGGIDLETVALHENGHALGLAHFGRLFVSTETGTLHTSPRAVMNAGYLGVLHRPLRTDRSAFCGTYASWPVR